MADEFDEFEEIADEDHLFLHPLELTNEHWASVRQMAQIVMRREKCDYLPAIVIAYLQLFEMMDPDREREH